MLPSNGSALALLRLVPFLFPLVFVAAAITGSMSALYVAVALHLIIVAAENTIGRSLSCVPIAPLLPGSTRFEDACLLIWPVFHLTALGAMLHLIGHTEPNARQVLALGAIFGYSINVFSATVGHELLHRRSRLGRAGADVLYGAMLYPHFPAVHLASHHKWAGSGRDCQTPRPGQQIYPYLGRALVGGLRIAPQAQAAALDPSLHWRIAAVVLVVAAFAVAGAWRSMMFLMVQGVFTFVIVETLNYIQHYRPMDARVGTLDRRSGLANQDLNFVSRCVLFNLPLHASHHADQHVHYSRLASVPDAPSCCWGYWTSFWLAWVPPLWNYLHGLKVR